jgi:hypothetical protein
MNRVVGTYAPYDRTKLLERIQTYPSDFINFSNSEGKVALNALVSAQRGWSWIGNNRIKCVSCNAVLSVKVPTFVDHIQAEDEQEAEKEEEEEEGEDAADDNQIVEGLVTRYLEDMTSQHYRNCPWSVNPTPSEIYRINDFDEEEIQRFIQRYQSLITYSDYLQGVQIWSRLNDEEIDGLRSFIEGLHKLQFNRTVVEAALLGWEISERLGEVLILYSKSDGRKLPLSGSNKTPVDLIEEHQSWDCHVLGYKRLLRAIEYSNSGVNDGFLNVHYHVDEDVENTDGPVPTDGADQEIDDRLQDSMKRLEKLKKVYF